ncbi:MAG: hypothetical protein HZA03_01805 [Nitrospinae bacterium]|nr:hypothetical protein [Nitrospinota bacterium]
MLEELAYLPDSYGIAKVKRQEYFEISGAGKASDNSVVIDYGTLNKLSDVVQKLIFSGREIVRVGQLDKGGILIYFGKSIKETAETYQIVRDETSSINIDWLEKERIGITFSMPYGTFQNSSQISVFNKRHPLISWMEAAHSRSKKNNNKRIMALLDGLSSKLYESAKWANLEEISKLNQFIAGWKKITDIAPEDYPPVAFEMTKAQFEGKEQDWFLRIQRERAFSTLKPHGKVKRTTGKPKDRTKNAEKKKIAIKKPKKGPKKIVKKKARK